VQVCHVKPSEIPRRLAEQKVWNVDEFYRQARERNDWHTYLFIVDGVDIGAAILIDDPLYDAIGVHTAIIDKPYRRDEIATTILLAIYKMTVRMAELFDRHYVLYGSPHPEKLLARLGYPPGAKVNEMIIRDEVR
jgi:hypothetical protein